MQLSSAVSRPVTLVFFALRCMTVARKRIFSHFSRFFHVLPIFPRRSCLAASPPPRTNRTRRVLHPVLSGHAASLTPY